MDLVGAAARVQPEPGAPGFDPESQRRAVDLGMDRPPPWRIFERQVERLAVDLNRLTGYETRSLVLGHLQRGGQPTPTDRLLATRFGAAAVRAIGCGKKNVMVALQASNITTVPLAIAIRKRKQVPRDYDVIKSARDLGVSFGDE